MTYELAVELKNCGFPQNNSTMAYLNELDNLFRRVVLIHTGGGHNGNEGLYAIKGYTCCLDEYNKADSDIDINDFIKNVEDKDLVRIPTLEELIEACGDKFINLSRDFFGAFKAYGPYAECGMGKTPKIAVANLYLVLNKK